MGASVKDFIINILGDSSGADRTFDRFGKKTKNTFGDIMRSSSALSSLGGVVGGEFGDALYQAGEGLSMVTEHSSKMSTTLLLGGTVITGVGVALQEMGAKDKQAADQLAQSIEASGHTWATYKDDIEKAIGSQENYGHSAADTQIALRKLTTATGDPAKALDKLGLAEDLAAAKNISLADASTLLSKILSGKGTRTLTEFGIVMGTSKDKTKNVDDAVTALSRKLAGQGSASMNNFGGFVSVVTTHLGDFAAVIGQEVGPALTILGPSLTGFGVIMDLIRAKKAADAEASLAAAAATEAQAAASGGATLAIGAEAVATDAAAVATKGLNLAFLVSPIGLIVEGTAALAAVMLVSAANTQAATAVQDSYAAAVAADNGVIGENTRLQAAKNLQDDGSLKTASLLGVAVDNLVNASLGSVPAHKAVTAALDKLAESYKSVERTSGLAGRGAIPAMTAAQRQARTEVDQLRTSMDSQAAGLKAATKAYNLYEKSIGVTTYATEEQFGAVVRTAAEYGTSVSAYAKAEKAQKTTEAQLQATTLAMQLQGDAAGLLSNAFTILNGGSLNVAQAQTGLAAANNALTKSFQDNKVVIDGTTEAAVANQQAVQAQVLAAQQAADAIGKQTGSVEAGVQAYKDSLASVEDDLRKKGELSGAVQAYLEKLYNVNDFKPKTTTLDVDTAVATAKVSALAAAIHAMNDIPFTHADLTGGHQRRGSYAVPAIPGYAAGGTIFGAGSAFSDTAGYYPLANGEEVTSNMYGQADKYRPVLKAINAGADVNQVTLAAAGLNRAPGSILRPGGSGPSSVGSGGGTTLEFHGEAGALASLFQIYERKADGSRVLVSKMGKQA